ncbi:MAG TPA: response regulator [Thermodesulfobacteriota bacterium]|nr:response regulator [Thermodesulfobacteriota bacterium]
MDSDRSKRKVWGRDFIGIRPGSVLSTNLSLIVSKIQKGGLNIAKGINIGSIWYKVELFKSAMESNRIIKKQAAKDKKKIDKKRALVIDDDDEIAGMEREILETEGFEVNFVNNGLEGLKEIKRNGYDVIISDFEMPQMKGDELYLEVKKLSKNLEKKIIFVSGNINDFIRSTENRFLAKPFSVDEFREAVRELTESDSPAEKK